MYKFDKVVYMKNIFCIVCFVLFLVSSIDAKEVSQLEERNGLMYEPNKEEPQTGRYVTYYENGLKESEGNLKEGKENGLWTLWYENGKKKREGNLKEGKLDGLWTLWDKNGNIIKTVTYSNGELVEQ